MKAAREYITALRKGLRNWEDYCNNGGDYIEVGGKEAFLKHIYDGTSRLRALEPQDVKDAILEHENDIAMRLKRLDDYKLLPTIIFVNDIVGQDTGQYAQDINQAINLYRQLIEEKALALIRVIEQCKKYLPPKKHPTIAKALTDPILLSYFYDNKKVLEDYVTYCMEARNATEMARRAGILCTKNKLKYEHLNNDLHERMKTLGFDVGTQNNWKGATRKARQEQP